MLVLAIDTALDACAAAVLDTENGALRAGESLALTRGHAEALMPLLARTVAAAGLRFPDLDRIAVTTGPGSFTGLRVGLSAARGLALASGRPAVGVSTLSAFAAPLIDATGTTPVLSAVDARHGCVYMQIVSGDGGEAVAPRVATYDEAFAALRAVAQTAHLVGNAAAMLAERWPSGWIAPASVTQTPAPDIAFVAWLGAAADPARARPVPLYLRPPDAKPQAQPMATA
jgi:tRNA threonylcarbamoyl adenosine modification protein YeaZ